MVPDLDRVLSAIAGKPLLTLTSSRCLRVSGGANCDRCVAACPTRLPFSDSDGILSSECLDLCTGCGACAAACPTGAIDVESRVLDEWVRRIDSGAAGIGTGSPTIACSLAEGDAFLRVTCAQALDDSVVLRAVLESSGDLKILVGDCAACPMGGSEVAERLESLAGRVNELSSVLGLPAVEVRRESHRRESAPSAGTSIDRRELLAAIGLESRALIASAFARADASHTPENAAPPATGALALRHSIAVDTIARAASLIPEERRATTRLPEREPGPLSHSVPCVEQDRCSACGECVPFCPTGALRKRTIDGEWRLSVSWSMCVGCGLCADLCRSQAITLEQRHIPGVVRTGRVLLVRRPTMSCGVCGAVFPDSRPLGSGETPSADPTPPVCALCSNRAQRFTGVY